MFCPNCGAKNGVEQNYCRGCGLKLDAIAEAVASQFPSKEFAAVQRRRERFEKLGMYSLSVAGLIGFAILLFKATQYKLILFGPDVLLGSAIAALIAFLLLSIVLFNFSKFFLKGKNRPLTTRADPRTSLTGISHGLEPHHRQTHRRPPVRLRPVRNRRNDPTLKHRVNSILHSAFAG
jgi:hypothetical protein